MSTTKRILAVTLGRKPMYAIAGFDGGMVHIMQSKSLASDYTAMLKETTKLFAMAKEKGLEVIIEDPTGFFREHGVIVDLAQRDVMGGSVMAKAMDNVIALQHRNAITFPVGMDGHFKLSDSILNEVTNDNGQRIYRVDWPNVKPENRLLILCVYGSVNNDPTRPSFIKQFYKALADKVKTTPKAVIPSTLSVNYATEFDKREPLKLKPIERKPTQIINKEINL